MKILYVRVVVRLGIHGLKVVGPLCGSHVTDCLDGYVPTVRRGLFALSKVTSHSALHVGERIKIASFAMGKDGHGYELQQD